MYFPSTGGFFALRGFFIFFVSNRIDHIQADRKQHRLCHIADRRAQQTQTADQQQIQRRADDAPEAPEQR